MRQTANIWAILAMAFLGSVSASVALAADGRPVSPKAVLAKHDPQGRLPNTTIRPLGTIRVRNSVYEVYYLDFTNPVSLHGQQRIAIVKNGSEFMGSYQCTLGRGPDDGSITFGSDRLMVTRDGMTFTIRFSEQGPTRNKYFCGEGSGWEDGI
jgi:hypothetical protein